MKATTVMMVNNKESMVMSAIIMITVIMIVIMKLRAKLTTIDNGNGDNDGNNRVIIRVPT